MRRFPPASRCTSLVRLFAATAIASGLALTTISAQIPGRNVNMVSGTTWPEGDPFLQRQNEPSVAASTRNPLHLMAGSNDYRTVDVPGLGPDETGDAWLGLYKSFDGGQRWISTLLPGYPQDDTEVGRASPIYGYSTGADPVVRAGTNGLMYYAGLAFNRSDPATPTVPGKSAIFVARFIDNNNKEAGDTFAYLGTRMLRSDPGGATGNFLDKPWMVVDIPRDTQRCIIETAGEKGTIRQDLPAGPVYVAYTLRSTDSRGPRYDVYFTRSLDCGNTWTAPLRLNDPSVRTSQGATMAIDPRNGDVYIAWRQFDLDGNGDGMIVVKYTRAGGTVSRPGFAYKFAKPKNGGGKGLDPTKFYSKGGVSKALEAARLSPLDQGTSASFLAFRTNAYPTITVDGTGRVYMAWAERGFAEDKDPVAGAARIRLRTSPDGLSWTSEPLTVSSEEPGQRGHQLMPSMTFAGGKLMLVYYDLRETRAQTFTQFIDDRTAFENPQGTGLRHTLDIRASMGTPGAAPAFEPSVRVSDYLEGPLVANGPNVPLQVNPPNLPMFVQGTSPFIGDYVDVAAAPQFIQQANGAWSYNTASNGTLPIFHAVWTDNRDVRAPVVEASNPPDNNPWNDYVPPVLPGTFSLIFPDTQLYCIPGNAGSRNQNIYTARITGGLLVGSPGNTKRLSENLMRSFVVFAQNTSDVARLFELTIVNPSLPDGRASFDQFEALPVIRANVGPRSTASRTVYVTSSDERARIDVSVTEVLPPGSSATPLTGTIVLNPDIDNPDIDNPDIDNQEIENPDIDNAEVYNPDIDNPDIDNPDIDNPDIDNPDIDNPDIDNIRVANPDIDNPDIDNPDIDNPDIDNPDIDNPDIDNPDIDNASLMTDVNWTITNTGNTTTAYNINLFFTQTTFDERINTQLLLYRTYKTPVVQGCNLKTETQNILVANIPNPQLVQSGSGVSDPNNPEIDNATLYLAPGESARITLRIFDPNPPPGSTVVITNDDGSTAIVPAQFVPNETVAPVIQQQGVDTAGLENQQTEPPIVLPPLTTVPDSAATAENTPVALNVLANDIGAFAPTRVISLHPAGMGAHTGSVSGDIAFQPSTRFLYTQRGAVDPNTNRIVGRFPAAGGSNGFGSQLANPRTGINYGRSTGTTAFLIALDARPDTPTFHQHLPMPALSDSVLALALDAAHGRLIAAHGPSTGNATTPTTVSVIDANPSSASFHQVIATVPLPIGVRAQAIAVNTRTRRAYVSTSGFVGGSTSGVFVFDTASAAPVATRLPTSTGTFGVAVNEAENLVFAAANTGGLFTLYVIDGMTGLVATVNTGATMRTGTADERLVVHEASGKVFMRLFNTVVVIDGQRASPTRNTVIHTINVGRENGFTDIAVDQELGRVVTVGNLDFRADVIDVATAISAELLLNSAPNDVAIDANSHRAFVSLANYVQEINLSPIAALGDALPVFVESGGILVNPTKNRGYGGVSTTFAGIGIFSGAGFLGHMAGVPTAGRYTFAERHIATNRHIFANLGDETGRTSDPGSVVVIDGDTDTVELLGNVAANPFGIGINQATGHVYIATLGNAGAVEHGTIEVGDANTLGDVGTATGVSGPLPNGFTLNNIGSIVQFGRHVVVNPANNKVYVMQLSLGSPNSLAVLDPVTLVLRPLDGQAGTPLFAAQSAAGEQWGRVEVIRAHAGLNRIFVGMTNTSAVTRIVAINSADDSVVGTWIGGAPSNLSTASYLIVNEAMNRLYVSNFQNDTLTTLDASTLAVIGTTNLPDGPAALAFNAAANRVYVSSVNAKTISAVDGTSLAVLSSVRLPLAALFLQVDPVEGRIYTAGGGASGDEAGTMVVTDVMGQLGTNVSVTSVGSALHGTVALGADYRITYTPSPGYSGPDSFSYDIQTPTGTASGTVNISVIPSVASPTAFSDTYSITSGQTLNIPAPGPLANDAVASGATMVVVDAPDHGDLTPSADGSFAYVPNASFTGIDTFTYHAMTAVGATNDVSVTVSVTSVASFVVTTTADSGAGSLRQAILNANVSPGAVITFNIPGAGPHVIQPTTALPNLTVPMTIDGYTQPGSSVNTLAVGTNAVIGIRLVGSSIGGSPNGLTVNGGNSTIRGLNIAGFGGVGILLDALGGNTIEGNFIGTNAAGTAAQSNAGGGVTSQTANNLIGGSTPAARNLLSGNTTNHGVRVQPRTSGTTVVHDGAGTVIRGNLIGTNALGTAALSNTRGIIVHSPNVIVGGLTAGERNVISGNSSFGIDSFPQRSGTTVLTAPSNLVIQGNYIGVRADGTAALANTSTGVIVAGPNTLIGGTAGTTVGACTGACNVISGNATNGVSFTYNYDNTAGSPTLGTLFGGATNSQVVGNFIGVDPTGATAIPNGSNGVSVNTADATIGGTSPGARNVISGNSGSGIQLGVNTVTSTGAVVGTGQNAQILGNYIGVAADGVTQRTNGGNGINLSTSNVTIGGTTSAARNIIAGNNSHGISGNAATFDADGAGPGFPVTQSIPSNLVVQGNYIGVNANGVAMSNNGAGIQTHGTALIGGTTGVSPTSCTGACNVVSGNVTNGIILNSHYDSTTGVVFSTAAGTQIVGNYIGMNPSGTGAVPNGPPLPTFSAGIGSGVPVVIGGPTAAERNIISGNRGSAINLYAQVRVPPGYPAVDETVISSAAGTTIYNNYIGLGPDGNTVFFNGNTGINLSVPNVTIGDTGMGNVISGNLTGGVSAFANFFDPDGIGPLASIPSDPPVVPSGLVIRDNRIGTNAAGTLPLGNGNPGALNLSAPGALVSGNVISGNTGYGVQLGQHFNSTTGEVYAAATGSVVENNMIGLNRAGTATVPNSSDGVRISAANVTVGGGAGARNMISGNAQHGISIFTNFTSANAPVGSATGGIVRGNYIGFDISGVNALPNGNGAVLSSAANTTVGGPNAGDGNLITHPTAALTGFGILFGRQLSGGVVISSGGGSTAMGNTIGINAAGARTGARASGLLVRSAGNMLVGNVIAGRGSNAVPSNPAAILIEAFVGETAGVGSANGNIIRGNYIGTDAAGATGLNNFSEGVAVSNASNTIIGGPAAGDRNVIVGGNAVGIHVSATTGNTSAGTVIEGNYIGLMPDGLTVSGNTTGVQVNGSSGAVTGTTIANNVISGNGFQGINIFGSQAAGATIRGNLIGTSADGTLPRGNADDAIIIGTSSGHTIGGLAPADANTLAFNTGDGVSLLTSGTGNRILGNRIHSNGNRGIDLDGGDGGPGVTGNDAGDGDNGPNNLQNFPVLSNATNTPGPTTSVTADLSSFAPGTFTVQFFASLSCDTSGNGEGERLVGSFAGVANGTIAAFSLTELVPANQFITATATDASGNTSEFAQCVAVPSSF